MKASKLPSGNYRCRLFVGIDNDGKKIYKSFTAPTKKLAEQKALEYRIDNKSFSNNTLYEAIEEYTSLRTSVLSASTIRKNKTMLEYLSDTFPDVLGKPVHLINSNDIQGIINEMSKEKAPKTVKNYYGLIHSATKDFCSLKVTLPKTTKKIKAMPTKAEIEVILSAAEGTSLYVPILLGSYCMMREGEIAALGPKDYNKAKKKLRINKTYVLGDNNKWVIQNHTKNLLEREIELPNRVCEAIDEYGLPDFDNPHMLYCRYRRLLDKLDMDYTFHTLRHFGASYFHALGIPMSYAQKYGGWKDLNTLLKVYQHTLDDQEGTIFSLLNDSI